MYAIEVIWPLTRDALSETYELYIFIKCRL